MVEEMREETMRCFPRTFDTGRWREVGYRGHIQPGGWREGRREGGREGGREGVWKSTPSGARLLLKVKVAATKPGGERCPQTANRKA